MTGKETDRKMTGEGPRAATVRALLWEEASSGCCTEMQVVGLGQDKGLDSS